LTNFLQNNNKKLIKEFFGYANVFNHIDADNDVVLQGAFDFGNDPPLPLLWQHDYKQPIGKVVACHCDEVSLLVKGDIFLDLQQAREAEILISNAVTNYLSIGFEVIDCYYKDNIRFISALKLHEVSVVTFPANSKTTLHIIEDFADLKLAMSRAQQTISLAYGG
jgi:HK97 family phage prohead protease